MTDPAILSAYDDGYQRGWKAYQDDGLNAAQPMFREQRTPEDHAYRIGWRAGFVDARDHYDDEVTRWYNERGGEA